LQAGAKEVGYPQTLSGIVPEAGIGLVHHQFKTANDTLELEMQKQVKMENELKFLSFNYILITQRFRENEFIFLFR
jgi:hypothetical protein